LWISTNIVFGPIWLVAGTWINFDCINIGWCFLLDSLSVSMLFVVLLISFLVHVFSIDYMYNDPFFLKFMSYLSLFTFFMLLLITLVTFFSYF
jgi:NADH:ubiquinone oxidoreductase subunit 5 (subunit L)/multisubunit Na+/H+ antiporter MnhA subunit